MPPAAAAAEDVTPILDEILDGMWLAATKAWPGVTIAPTVFVEYVAARVARDVEVSAGLQAMHASDLYLACGCARGEPEALAAFENAFTSRVPTYLARANATRDFIEEVKQNLRTRLFTADRGQPYIAKYLGRGPLGAWVRVATLRIAMDLHRALGQPADMRPFETPALEPAIGSPELTYLKQRYGSLVTQAIEAALAALSAREANMLKLFFLQQVSHEGLAGIYRVSSRTTRRSIAAIRERIIAETRRHLIEEMGVAIAEVDTLIRLVSADLDPSIVRFLKRPR